MFPLFDNVPHRRFPWITCGIIGACVAVYLLQLANPHLAENLAFRPAYLLTREGWSLGPGGILLAALASMFLHGGLLHLGFNMWFLWIFGDNVEDRMGHLRYLLFYLLCGLLATLAHVVSVEAGFLLGAPQVLRTTGGTLSPLSIPMIGASGAIAGVLGAYYRLFPRASIRTLIIIIFFVTLVDLPAVVFIVIWLLGQLLSGLTSLGGVTGVAFWAHVGGFLAGLWLVRWFAWVRRARPPTPRVVDMRWE